MTSYAKNYVGAIQSCTRHFRHIIGTHHIHNHHFLIIIAESLDFKQFIETNLAFMTNARKIIDPWSFIDLKLSHFLKLNSFVVIMFGFFHYLQLIICLCQSAFL